MSKPVIKLISFLAGLVMLFGAGYGLGRVSGLAPRGVEVHDDSQSEHGEMP